MRKGAVTAEVNKNLPFLFALWKTGPYTESTKLYCIYNFSKLNFSKIKGEAK
jgi:hypothetical protein